MTRSACFVVASFLTIFVVTSPARAQTGELQTFVDALGNIGENIAETDAYKNSQNLRTVSNGLQSLSTLGPILAVAGAGLELFALISGVPTQDEIITAKLDEISEGVSRIENKLGSYYVRSGNRARYISLSTSISRDFSDIEAMRKDWLTLQDLNSPPQNRRKARADFNARSAHINEWAQRIRDVCVKGTPAHTDLFAALEAHTFGDEQVITEWGKLVLITLTNLAMFESYAISQQSGGGMSKAQAQAVMQGNILMGEDISDMLEMLHECTEKYSESLDRIRSPAKIQENSKAFIEARFSDTGRLETAFAYAQLLQARYPHRDWVVLTYAPVYGFDNFSIVGRNYHAMFRTKIGDSKHNFVVHHFPIQSSETTPEASAQTDAYADILKKITSQDCIVNSCSFSWGDYKKYLGYPGPYPFLAAAIPSNTPNSKVYNHKLGEVDLRVPLNQLKRGPFLAVGRIKETGYPIFGWTNSNYSNISIGANVWALTSH